MRGRGKHRALVAGRRRTFHRAFRLFKKVVRSLTVSLSLEVLAAFPHGHYQPNAMSRWFLNVETVDAPLDLLDRFVFGEALENTGANFGTTNGSHTLIERMLLLTRHTKGGHTAILNWETGTRPVSCWGPPCKDPLATHEYWFNIAVGATSLAEWRVDVDFATWAGGVDRTASFSTSRKQCTTLFASLELAICRRKDRNIKHRDQISSV